MGRKCCVFGCRTGYKKQLTDQKMKITVYRFPKDEEKRRRWVASLPNQLNLKDVTDNMVVCALHWPKDVPMERNTGRYHVPAVSPSIFQNVPQSCIPSPSCRAPRPTKKSTQEARAHDDYIKWIVETDNIQSSAGEIIPEDQVSDKMDSKIPASVEIELPDVYIDYPDEAMTENFSQIQHDAVDKALRLTKVLGGKGFDDNTHGESNNLIDVPLTYEDLLELTKSASEEEEEATDSEEEEEATDPTCETDNVQSSAGKIISEDQVFDKMDSKIPASVKIEQPYVYIDYADESMKSMESHNLSPSNNIKLEPACEVRLSNKIKLEPACEVRPFNNIKLEPACKVRPSNNLKLEPACETDNAQSSAGKIISEDQVFDKMDSKIPANVKIEQPYVYIDYADESLKSMESHNLLPSNNIEPEAACEVRPSNNIKLEPACEVRPSNNIELEAACEVRPNNNIKLEPACETDNVQSSAGEIISEDQVSDKMDSEIPASVKTEEPYVYIDYADESTKNMESHSQLPSNNIKLEPACEVRPSNNIKLEPARETDNVQSSAGENISEDQVFDKMDSKITASVSIEQPYMYMDYADESVKICLFSESCSSRQEQTKTEKMVFGNKDRTLGKRRQPDVLCEDKSHKFSKMDTFVHRQKTTNAGEQPYKCNICSSFAIGSHLKRHMRAHTGERPYKCDICHSSFTYSNDLKYHVRIHTGEKPYKCDFCGASFTHLSQMKLHLIAHTGEKPFKCDVCAISFTAATSVRRHMELNHAGEKPNKCNICGESFTRARILNGHMRTHTGKKPYKCGVCGASFSRIGFLKSHVKIHTEEKPYKCGICGASFTSSSGLRYHARAHTVEKPS